MVLRVRPTSNYERNRLRRIVRRSKDRIEAKRAAPGRYVWVIPSGVFRAKGNLVKWYNEAMVATTPTNADKRVNNRYDVNDVAWVVEELLKRA